MLLVPCGCAEFLSLIVPRRSQEMKEYFFHLLLLYVCPREENNSLSLIMLQTTCRMLPGYLGTSVGREWEGRPRGALGLRWATPVALPLPAYWHSSTEWLDAASPSEPNGCKLNRVQILLLCGFNSFNSQKARLNSPFNCKIKLDSLGSSQKAILIITLCAEPLTFLIYPNLMFSNWTQNSTIHLCLIALPL